MDKLLLSAAEQDVLDASLTVLDTHLLLGDDSHDSRWRDEWWYSRAASVYGGAREIQHSIIADRILSLPKERSRWTLIRGSFLQGRFALSCSRIRER